MLVVFSDIHLTDQSTSSNVHASAFELLAREIATAAGPKHKRAQSLDFLLLGDIFDLYRTSYWHDQHVPPAQRPWNGRLSPDTGMNSLTQEVENQFLSILERILAADACRALFDLLRNPPPTVRKKPTVTCVIGNHDRPIWVFPSLQDQLRRELSGVNLSFANSFRSDKYQVLARHGHEWDPNNCGWLFLTKVLQPGRTIDRFDPEVHKVQCIGDVVTAELLSGMLYRLGQQLSPNSPDDRAFLHGLYEVNNLRPVTAVFEWMSWFSQDRPSAENKYLDLLRKSLREAIAETLDSQLARAWDRLKPDLWVGGDLTDQLDRAYTILRHRNGLRLLASLKPALSAIASAVGLSADSAGADACFAGAADDFAQEEKANRQTRYLFYGHTHEARQECFKSTPNGQVQLYVNTGTFLPFIQRAHNRQGFWAAHRLTYAFVYSDREDRRSRHGPGPTLDIWNGLRCKRYVIDER